jgi:hypothetical protein
LPQGREEEHVRGLRIVAVAASLAASLVVVTAAMGQALPRPETWVDGERFAGVVTPATFAPANGNFDELYMCTDGTTFRDGVPLISESGPGDQDYNGGRWHLNVGTSCDPTADSVDDLDLGDFTSTTTYFECPLLARRGNG